MKVWSRQIARWLVALVVGVFVFAIVAASPVLWDTALLAGWDAGVLTWLILVFLLMGRADAQRTWRHVQALEPATLYTLVVVMITAAVGLLGAVALSTRAVSGRGQLAQVVHFAAGAIAVVEAWLLLHTEFALYYARLYYDEAVPVAPDNVDALDIRTARYDGNVVPFRKGLEFPDKEEVDYWDFMYYSYTIAMCYQTSDVTVASSPMRRVTLVHAIMSFAFVLVILGYAVNAIGNVL